MMLHWSSLIPPLLVLTIVIACNRIILALCAGIISAGIIATHGSFLETLYVIKNATMATLSNVDMLYLYGFLIVLGTLITLLTTTGATIAFARSITKTITTASAAEFSCILLSLVLAIDDYLNIPTTGRIMSPLADRLGVSRLKIAFLIHAFAGPLVLMIPISSWAGAVVAYIGNAGVSAQTSHESTRIIADPFFVYLWSLPFMLYSICLFISIIGIIKYQISFGPMQRYEKSTQLQPESSVETHEPGISSLLLPLIVLLFSIFAGLAYTGGYSPSGSCSLLQAIQTNKDGFFVMFIAACSALITAIIMSIARKTFSISQLPATFKDGFLIMYSGIILVILATILSRLLADYVGTGQYLAHILLGNMPLALIPVMFFIVSFICSSATGSAWGCFALLIPIAIPMLSSLTSAPLPVAPACIPLLFPTIGAIFSGSACGNHLSPLADTTMLTALSTQTDPMHHALTQFPYGVPAFVGAFCGFLIAGFMLTQTGLSFAITLAITLGASVAISLACLLLLNRLLRAN